MSEWVLILLAVLLLLFSAFFVAAEFALVSAKRSEIEPQAVYNPRARATLRAMEDVSLMMACAQLGITVCAVLLGTLGEPAVAALLEPLFESLGVAEAWLHPVSLTIALLLVVSAHVALGEMVPKNIAIARPDRVAVALGPILAVIARMLGPLLRGLNHLANALVRLLGQEPKNEVASAFTKDEVAGLISESSAEGLLDTEEQGRLTSALQFDEATIGSIVVPDAQIVTVPFGATPEDVEEACARTGFSRFPVRADDGRYVGYLHIRDVVTVSDEDRFRPVPANRIRGLPTLAAEDSLRSALDEMRRAGAHLAQVSGAGRGTPVPAERAGVVMLEDAIEELIGEIRDATRRRG